MIINRRFQTSLMTKVDLFLQNKCNFKHIYTIYLNETLFLRVHDLPQFYTSTWYQ